MTSTGSGICSGVCMSIGGRAHLNLKVPMDVREEDHFFFVPQLLVIRLDSPSDSPSLSAQPDQHLHEMRRSMCVCMCVKSPQWLLDIYNTVQKVEDSVIFFKFSLMCTTAVQYK